MIGRLKALVWWLLARVPGGRVVAQTRRTQTPVRLLALLRYLIGRKRGQPYWPIPATSIVADADRIVAGIETSPGLRPGSYIQASNGIEIGDYTQMAANVVMISAYCVIAGNPARLLRRLNPEQCVRHRSGHEYNGFIVHHRFEQLRRKYLSR